MRSKFKWIFTLLLALSMQFSFAQEKTVTGVVSDETGPLPGANVIVKGTKRGVQTDVDGKYSIQAKSGEVLIFSYIGMADASVAVGASNTINTVLKSGSGVELGEVVVTSQGIRKEKKALGYSVTTIKSEDFASKPSTDVARALTGKAPGVNIQQTSGLSGSGTNIVIRGRSSITGNNQPLFVVDGIPFNSDTNKDGNFIEGATNASSRFLDLDPNSIESVSILKGLSATTLYGSAGKNGVILVTTKSGNTKGINRKMEVNFSQSMYMTEIGSVAKYQNSYGNGFDNGYSTAFSNWGPKFGTAGTQGINEDGTVPHPYAYLTAAFPEYSNADGTPKTVAYRPYNNVRPFFTTGTVSTTSVNIGGRSEGTSYNLSVGHTNDAGFIENNTYRRLNLSSGGTTKLSNGFTISSTMNYVKTDKTAPPTAAGFGSNAAAPSVFANILYTPRSFDLFGLPYENPLTHASVNYRTDIPNPRWTLKNASDDEAVRRFYGSFTAAYEINSWSNISYVYALDNYTQTKTYYINKGNGQAFYNDGYLRTTVRENTINNHTLSYNFDTKIDKNQNWNVDGTLGFNPRQEASHYDYTDSSGQTIYGLLEHQYFENQYAESGRQQFNIMGLYASTTLGFKKFLFLNLQGRNDWFSSLQRENRSLFYPSASLSVVPTDAFEFLKNNNTLNYMKLRAGYGSSAGFPDPYKSVVGINSESKAFLTDEGTVINTNLPYVNPGTGNVLLGNKNLKPELFKELEFGLEAKLFNNRLGIDFSIYDKRSKDLIIERALGPETGAEEILDNLAEVSNKGYELGINLIPIKSETDGFTWEISGQISKNRNIVENLGTDGSIKRVYIDGFTNLGNFAVAGRPYGVLYGDAILRDANGNFMVGSDGNYLVTGEDVEIGDPNPDWKSTVINELSYKNITFGFQLEYQKGGDIYSTTAASLLSRGLTRDTDFDRSGTVVLPGVNQNGNVNTTQIGYTQYGFNNSGFFIREQGVYDATNLRVREVSLSYSLPKKYLEKTPFGKISISFVGQNLWFKAFNFPKYLQFDPEVSSLGVGNGSGFDYLTGPTSKRYGFNFNLTF